MSERDKHISWLEREIPKQGQVLRRAVASFAAPIEEVISQALTRRADDWVVTGCGDSLFTGLCAEVWFAQRAHRRLRAVHAMSLSRYLYEGLGPRSVVLAVSHSGTTARVVEAARAARSRGALVLAVTANTESELAYIADAWVDNSVHAERSNARTASFQAVCALMRGLAERLTAVTGGAELELTSLAESVDRFVGPAGEQVAALDEAMLTGEHWLFTGAGLGYGTANYGMAKLYEAATLPAHVSELEQLIHCEIFTVRPGTVVVMVCPRGHSSSRAVELANGLGRLGATTIAVTNDADLTRVCSATIRLPEDMIEDDLPFLAAVPLQWLALRVALLRGEDPDLVGNKSINRPLIDQSAQWGQTVYQQDPVVASAVSRQ